MLEVHAILHRQRCYENMTEKTGTLSDAYSESHYVIENGNVYWEVEYHHWSGHPGTQIAFMHFMSNGNYAVDITKQEFEKQTGKKAKKGK